MILLLFSHHYTILVVHIPALAAFVVGCCVSGTDLLCVLSILLFWSMFSKYNSLAHFSPILLFHFLLLPSGRVCLIGGGVVRPPWFMSCCNALPCLPLPWWAIPEPHHLGISEASAMLEFCCLWWPLALVIMYLLTVAAHVFDNCGAHVFLFLFSYSFHIVVVYGITCISVLWHRCMFWVYHACICWT